MLSLVEYFVSTEILHDTLIYYGDVFIKGIMIPCIEWRVGKPNVKIREAAIICLMKMIELNIVDSDVLHNNFTDLFLPLKNCLADDFASNIRYTAVVFMKPMLKHMGEKMEHDDYREIYPELLNRMDDAQD